MSEYTSNALRAPVGLAGMLGGMSNMTIRVTPEEMEAKAQAVVNEVSVMKGEYDEMKNLVKNTSTYWNGDAADLHRKRFIEMQDEVESMFRRLNEHAENLQEIAAIYTGTQIKVTDRGNTLPTTAIE